MLIPCGSLYIRKGNPSAARPVLTEERYRYLDVDLKYYDLVCKQSSRYRLAAYLTPWEMRIGYSVP